MEFLFFDKPAGVTTHLSEHESETSRARWGFAEMLKFSLSSSQMKPQLFVAHRLDRDTTGAVVFAGTSADAEILRQLFTDHKVKKTYLFITDRTARENTFMVQSWIERVGGNYISTEADPSGEIVTPNATTHFQLLETKDGLSLWQARPESGKPHQIRLHASDSGIAILGDKVHGGASFPTLCLHSSSLDFSVNGKDFHHECPAPIWFRDLSLVKNSLLIRWLSSIDRRERWMRSVGGEFDTIRMIHSEGDPLRMEKLGEVEWLNWFDDRNPTAAEMDLLRQLGRLVGWKKPFLQLRGKSQVNGELEPPRAIFTESEPLPERWRATESQLNFEFRSHSGLSPGLFLDQRQNRLWVRKHARGLKVLNLFCYTGGFSLAAAAGGAAKIVSVDLSKNFIEWAKVNFQLNHFGGEGVQPDSLQYEFRAMDSFEYLSWALKKGLRFDLVICDPPSFSRGKSGVFSIDKDFEKLIQALIPVAESKAQILFSTNYEKWTETILIDRIRLLVKKNALPVEVSFTPEPDWDFELPGQARNMKSVILKKK